MELNNLYRDEEDGVPYHNLTHGFDVAIVILLSSRHLIDF